MRVRLDVTRSVQENAERYFERAKQAKRKARGAREALGRIAQRDEPEPEQEQQREKKREHWFMDHHWLFTSSGKLAIGGRSASGNEQVVKKHTNKLDLVFHTDIQGSPFFVAKLERGHDLTDEEKQGIANTTASFSRAWKYGVASVDVYAVRGDQVSKSARAGEYISKGSFMLYGERDTIPAALELFISIIEYRGDRYAMLSGERAGSFVRIVPGSLKPTDAAKRIHERLTSRDIKDITVDEIARQLPAGPIDVEALSDEVSVRQVG